MWSHGAASTPRIKRLFFTALEGTREPVPVWHRSSSSWDIRMSMRSKVDGRNGIMQVSRSRKNDLARVPLSDERIEDRGGSPKRKSASC